MPENQQVKGTFDGEAPTENRVITVGVVRGRADDQQHPRLNTRFHAGRLSAEECVKRGVDGGGDCHQNRRDTCNMFSRCSRNRVRR